MISNYFKDQIEPEKLQESLEDPKDGGSAPTNKFSKSFEVSLENMDNLIGRVDNGIKFKRGSNAAPPATDSGDEKSNSDPSTDLTISDIVIIVNDLYQIIKIC